MKTFVAMLLLWCSLVIYAYGGIVIIRTSGVVTCDTGSLDTSFTTGTDTSVVTSDARGQSWTPSTTGYVYSIEVELSHGSSEDAKMRWGPDADLTSTYYGESSLVSVSSQAYYEFVFQDTTNQISNGTTYYLGIISDGTQITFYRNNSGGYGDGQYYYASGSGGWNMANTLSGYDMNFKLNLCD